ncbi:hypothetical protein AOQ84DRAFT_365656 [Glonium stellatum]|uniref:Uncharacterized protein n=1 Tax=Glonium stellatum TaxID=574774 RepID=A0A8E2JR65_9PEZI|nr:hypothetical protein AOQ84DRAFT_365656 [Glonium stellatum]
MAVCVDPAVTSCFVPIAGANWAMGREQEVREEEVREVREVREEVRAAPTASKADGVKGCSTTAVSQRGQGPVMPEAGVVVVVDAVAGGLGERAVGRIEAARTGLEERSRGIDAAAEEDDAGSDGSNAMRGATAGSYTGGLGLLVAVRCPRAGKALTKSMETADLVERTKVDKKPDRQYGELSKSGITLELSEISKPVVTAGLGCVGVAVRRPHLHSYEYLWAPLLHHALPNPVGQRSDRVQCRTTKYEGSRHRYAFSSRRKAWFDGLLCPTSALTTNPKTRTALTPLQRPAWSSDRDAHFRASKLPSFLPAHLPGATRYQMYCSAS